MRQKGDKPFFQTMRFPCPLTHWGRVTHICVSELTTIGSDNGLSLGRRLAIIWSNDGILLIRPLGTNFSEILLGIQISSFNKMHLKMSSAKWRPFCLGLNVLTHICATRNHFYLHGLTWTPAWTGKHVPIEVWEWISKFMSDFIMDAITYPCLD